MIKIVHTSDWHAGKSNGKESRREDLQYSLNQIEQFIKEERVDFLLVCGDIFDKPSISPQDMLIIWNFFINIKQYGTKSIAITGNHDSKEFFNSMKSLLKLIDVYVFDRVSPEIKSSFVEFEKEQDGKICFFAFPYLNPNIPVDVYEKFSSSSYSEKYTDFVVRYLELASGYALNFSCPVIMLSHIAISEAKISGTEKEISVRQDFCVPHARVPQNFLYYALGHIHKNQRVSNTKRMYYSGTLYQIDFGEEKDENKGFYFFTIKDGKIDKEPEFQRVSLKRKLKTYDFDLTNSNVNSIVQQLSSSKDTLKRIFLYYKPEQKHLIPEIVSKINNLEGIISINFDEIDNKNEMQKDIDYSELSYMDIISLYEKFYSEVKGGDLDFFRNKIQPRIMKLIEEFEKSQMVEGA